VSIVTNIATTHTLYLQDKVGVAGEKGKMISALKSDGVAVLNKDDKLVCSLAKNTKSKVVYFGENTEVSASDIKLNKDLSTDFVLKIGAHGEKIHINALGKQFVKNALASAAAAKSLGVSTKNIIKGISSFRPPEHRLNVFRSKKYGLVFDDTYNSNPRAAIESLDTFKEISAGKTKVAVIGDMLELGKFEERSHRELGKEAGKTGFSHIVGVGKAARFVVEEASKFIGNDNCYLAGSYKESLNIVKPLLGKNSALFVKGSRSIQLDKLVDCLI
jgi:UDP-N-acetylmuramyl pentapeptide synthase